MRNIQPTTNLMRAPTTYVEDKSPHRKCFESMRTRSDRPAAATIKRGSASRKSLHWMSALSTIGFLRLSVYHGYELVYGIQARFADKYCLHSPNFTQIFRISAEV